MRLSGVRDPAEQPPKVYTDIHMHFVVTGNDVQEAQVQRAVELSMTKYCSASLTLGKAAKLTYDWEIKEA